jgi:UDP-N-acetylglucosamine---dolichyl-phosphate N-acetylglucosaminyltransferase
MKLAVIIPAYNEEKYISYVIQGAKKHTDNIIVIDDGSKDNTFKIAQENGAKVYRHLVNRGLGGALGTGIKAALLSGADIIITLDADGQHSPNEIPKIIEPIIKNEADMVIGSRFLTRQKMPFFRRWGNYFFNLITFFLFGLWSSDSQSGFRAFNRKAVQSLEVQTNGMEISSEILKEIKINNFKIKEVPIKSIYTDYSLSKGQGLGLGFKTLIKLFILKLTE